MVAISRRMAYALAQTIVAIPLPHSEKTEYTQRALPQYVNALHSAGLEALTIPPDTRPDEIARMVAGCQGVLLPGSPADVDPQKYSARREPRCNPADPSRDTVDELLLQDAHNMHKPVLAICYGLQSLNVWRTGSLIQHLETNVNHQFTQDAGFAHEVEIEPGTLLASLLSKTQEAKMREGKLRLPVNSSHHQAALALGDGLRVSARCPQDNVIEALEGISPDHWICAVQWHPERLQDAASSALFSGFANAAKAWTPRAITESVG